MVQQRSGRSRAAANDLSKMAKDRKIRYFLISFVDLFGVLRAKLVPARAIIPDPSSLIQLPWKPEVGWVAGDLWMDGKEVEDSPRVALKRQIARANKAGFRPKVGVECEYFLTNADGTAISDERDIQDKPCYDQSALMRRYDVISEICDCMLEFGWGAYR
jgi:glutamine synthetase